MTSKQKAEVLALIVVAKSGLDEAKQALKAVAELLKQGGESKGSMHATAIVSAIEDDEWAVQQLVQDYQHFMDDMRTQANRLLRLAASTETVQ